MEQRPLTLANVKMEGVGGEPDEIAVGRLGTGLKCRARDGVNLRPAAGVASRFQTTHMV